jgi:transcriptional regulator with XRE-family HTH domain
MNDYNVGSKFRKLRKDRNLTLKLVSKETKISPAMLSMIENNNASPSLKSISILASFYDISLSNLFSTN